MVNINKLKQIIMNNEIINSIIVVMVALLAMTLGMKYHFNVIKRKLEEQTYIQTCKDLFDFLMNPKGTMFKTSIFETGIGNLGRVFPSDGNSLSGTMDIKNRYSLIFDLNVTPEERRVKIQLETKEKEAIVLYQKDVTVCI